MADRHLPAWMDRLARAFAQRARTRGDRSLAWRVGKPLAFAAVGALMATSFINSDGIDLRPERNDGLAGLAEQQSDRVQALEDDISSLSSDIDALTEQQASAELSRLQEQVESLETPAGLTAMEGPGLTVTLDDAPAEVRAAAGTEIGSAIVHQQDIQAVVNALWAGGAEAMTLQGQRVVATTGIKCVGNSVILHGVPYSPPYVISAIGDTPVLFGSLGESAYIRAYLKAVNVWQLGWKVTPEEKLVAPAFDRTMSLRYARAAEPVDSENS